ncbi:uncharacterized protein [Mytilus edulis]|uniref:uncharacterized protein n=1 Tax=Mytilus edulis TaxID=6550 RepID=UPI0039F044AB
MTNTLVIVSISVITVVCILLGIIMVLTKVCLKRTRKIRHKDNSATEGTCMTDSPEGFPVPMNHRQNNLEERKDPLNDHGDVKTRTVQADLRHVLSSNETGYADVWC